MPSHSEHTPPLVFGEGLDAIRARGIEPASKKGAQLWYFRIACDTAMDSGCLKSRCGAVLVNVPLFVRPSQDALFLSSLVAVGFNGPPQNDPAYRRCGETTPSLEHPKAGRTCCVHAEVRALLSAPRERIRDATLYFARVDETGALSPSGRPWCTECSKLALDLGVKTWVLWHADGPAEYDADHYDWLSNQYDAYEASVEVDRGPEADGERF